MFIVISYDVSDDRRRRRVVRVLENYGKRVQFSVFEHRISGRQLSQIKRKLASEIRESDNIRYYRLCKNCVTKVEVQGRAEINTDQPYFMF